MGVTYRKTKHAHWPYQIEVKGARVHELVEWTDAWSWVLDTRIWYWLNGLKRVPVWGWVPWWLGGTTMPSYGIHYYDDREIQSMVTGKRYDEEVDLSVLQFNFARKDEALLFRMTWL